MNKKLHLKEENENESMKQIKNLQEQVKALEEQIMKEENENVPLQIEGKPKEVIINTL